MSEVRAWVENQRELARALGLSIEEWLEALARASERRPGLTAAALGAAMARGIGAGTIRELDAESLYEAARGLLDPDPPRVKHPLVKEAVRRSDELQPGKGAARLRARRGSPKTPVRGEGSLGPSSGLGTADAPGEDS